MILALVIAAQARMWGGAGMGCATMKKHLMTALATAGRRERQTLY